MKWVGYISDARTYTPGAAVTALIRIAPPLPAGSPGPASFSVLVILGSRGVTPDLPATRPVACGASLTEVSLDEATICKDSAGGGFRGSFRNFAFLTPAPVTVQPGQTAVIPVTGKFAGAANPAINFALTATTTLPGASAVPNVPTLAPPTDSTTAVSVSVPVPASAAPGTYAVTLTGTLGSGESRSATGTLIVPGPTGAPTLTGRPSLSKLKASPTTISSARGSAPSLISVTLSDPGRLTILLERRVAGRRKKGHCVAPTPTLRRAGAARCTRFVTISSITRVGLGAGLAKLSISGRVGRHPRGPGTYRLTLTSLGATGVASLPLRTTLTITG